MGDKVAADFIYDPPAHNTRCHVPHLHHHLNLNLSLIWNDWTELNWSDLPQQISDWSFFPAGTQGKGGRVSGQVNVDALPRNQIIKHNDRNII